MKEREQMIANYIKAYNQFDIDKMMADFDEHIVFENISNGAQSMLLTGLTTFREQAEQAKQYFSERRQNIRSFSHQGNETEVEIDYYAILANDLPNGLKKGEALNLQGRSIFTFEGNKISRLTDIS